MRPMMLATFLLFASLTFAGTGTPQAPQNLPTKPTLVLASFHPIDECGDMTPPEPMDSPHPILNGQTLVKVDFIIGWDGKVYSPFLLMTNGNTATNAQVLRIVRSWRFRPATCGKSPMNSEGQVTFVKE